MNRSLLWIAMGIAGCQGIPSSVGVGVGSVEQPLTSGQLTALNNVGRTTGIVYGLADPPNPDLAALELVFNPVTGLRRTSDYVGLAGGLLATVTADPPGGVDPPEPDLPQLSVANAAGQPVLLVTGDPPGGRVIACQAFGALGTANLSITPNDRTVNFALGGATAGITVTTDPPSEADPPGELHFTVRVNGTGRVQLYQGTSPDPVWSTPPTTAP